MLAITLTALHQHLQVIDLEHALQTLRPCQREVARRHGLIGGLCLASATSGRGNLLTQSMIRCEHPVANSPGVNLDACSAPAGCATPRVSMT